MTKKKEYPYKHVLEESGSKFYVDEAYVEAVEENDIELASICDTCDAPAEFMTFSLAKVEYEDDPDWEPDPDDEYGEAYYVCRDCIKRFVIEDMV
jgi:hypothetical protein